MASQICRQKLPKTAQQRGREKFQYNFFYLRIRCGVGWLVQPHVPSFFLRAEQGMKP
jgi:hypothetical protein